MVGPASARRGTAWYGVARHDVAELDGTGRGLAGPGAVRRSSAKQRVTGRGQAWLDRAGPGRAWHGDTRQGSFFEMSLRDLLLAMNRTAGEVDVLGDVFAQELADVLRALERRLVPLVTEAADNRPTSIIRAAQANAARKAL